MSKTATSAASTPPGIGDVVLKVEGVSKSFGPIDALVDIDLELRRGEIVALVGDNGAGKSTLAKVIAGVHQPTEGRLYLDGEPVVFHNPADARKKGIETVYQDLALVEELDVAGNFFLGREELGPGLLGRIFNVLNTKSMRAQAGKAMEDIHIKIPDITKPVRRMSGGQRQAVAIGRTVFWGRKIMVLDEPTAALGVEEADQVLSILESFERSRALPILVISHNMEHVYRVADRIVVLRHGRKVADLLKSETTPRDIVGYITGAMSAEEDSPKQVEGGGQ